MSFNLYLCAFVPARNRHEKSMLELVCKVYNINVGKNNELLERCKWLADYMVFVDKVREYHNDRTEAELEEVMKSVGIPESEYDIYLKML